MSYCIFPLVLVGAACVLSVKSSFEIEFNAIRSPSGLAENCNFLNQCHYGD